MSSIPSSFFNSCVFISIFSTLTVLGLEGPPPALYGRRTPHTLAAHAATPLTPPPPHPSPLLLPPRARACCVEPARRRALLGCDARLLLVACFLSPASGTTHRLLASRRAASCIPPDQFLCHSVQGTAKCLPSSCGR
jgi:hypothetical protein